MATLTIRQIDDKIKSKLRIQAAHHGRSMEEEAREILRQALAEDQPLQKNLADSIMRRFTACKGVELELPEREPIRQPPSFSA
jgi:antitoxin FitA